MKRSIFLTALEHNVDGLLPTESGDETKEELVQAWADLKCIEKLVECLRLSPLSEQEALLESELAAADGDRFSPDRLLGKLKTAIGAVLTKVCCSFVVPSTPHFARHHYLSAHLLSAPSLTCVAHWARPTVLVAIAMPIIPIPQLLITATTLPRNAHACRRTARPR